MFSYHSASRFSCSFSSIRTRWLHRTSNVNAAKVLVFGEHKNGIISKSVFSSVQAAQQLNPDSIELIFVGSKALDASQNSKNINGIKKVFFRNSELYDHGSAEVLAKFLAGIHETQKYTHILTASSNLTKNFIPRLAALLDVQAITDVLAIKGDDTFVRPIYAGNALCTLKSEQSLHIFTIRSTCFDPSPSTQESTRESDSGNVEIEEIISDFGAESVVRTKWISIQTPNQDLPELATAEIVISGGRALKSKENFKLLYDIAEIFGNKAAVGATRAVVDAGYVSNDLQIGQTGKIVAPNLYIAIGISGAIQHLAGMKDSKTIVAINKDPDAPIFKVADYGLVDDLFNVVPELIKKIKDKK